MPTSTELSLIGAGAGRRLHHANRMGPRAYPPMEGLRGHPPQSVLHLSRCLHSAPF